MKTLYHFTPTELKALMSEAKRYLSKKGIAYHTTLSFINDVILAMSRSNKVGSLNKNQAYGYFWVSIKNKIKELRRKEARYRKTFSYLEDYHENDLKTAANKIEKEKEDKAKVIETFQIVERSRILTNRNLSIQILSYMGYSAETIAEMFNLSKRMVHRIIRENISTMRQYFSKTEASTFV